VLVARDRSRKIAERQVAIAAAHLGGDDPVVDDGRRVGVASIRNCRRVVVCLGPNAGADGADVDQLRRRCARSQKQSGRVAFKRLRRYRAAIENAALDRGRMRAIRRARNLQASRRKAVVRAKKEIGVKSSSVS
jgi:hypothetical protein